MDRLVKADVKGIELVFIKGQKSSATFTLTNLMHTMSVAVSLSTKTPSLFSFHQPFSLIPPLSSSPYTLLSHPSDQPPLTDAITVKTSMVPLGKATLDSPSPDPTYSRTPLCPSPFSVTALLKSAAVAGKADLVRSLIDHGGDVNHKDSNGRSLVSLAAEAGHLDVVNVLISSGCEIDNSIDHVFHYAAAIDNVDLMDALFRAYKNSVNFNSRSPIHISAIHGYIQVVRFCLSVGASPDVLDINKCTPLHLAAKGDVLNRAARVGDVNGIKSCIGEGANVNGKDQNGWTPLHRAAFKGKLESVRVLLGYGVEVNVVDNNGYTPLHCVAEAGHVEVALLLIGHGAKANLKSLKGMGMEIALKSDCSKNHR
ncbi:hypothetical protein V6N13_021904 [Hibiscus sabdariffa]